MRRGTLQFVPNPPAFTLTPAQQVALVVIEVQQQSLIAAGQMLAHKNIDQQAAAKALETGLKALDEAKMVWLRDTQRQVQLVPDLAGLPDRVKVNGGSLGG